MAIRSFEDRTPSVDPDAWIDPLAVVIGDVAIGAGASLWPFVVARGDVHSIRIGPRTNVQDGSILHVTHAHDRAPAGHALVIGAEVTVGHRVILHGCTVGDLCLIGMGATIMDGATLEPRTIVGAGALVPPGKRLEGGHLWVGSPVRRVRALSAQELAHLPYAAANYVALARRHAGGALS